MKLLKNLKVRKKIILLIVISIMITLLIAGLSYVQTRNMTKNIEDIYEEKFIPNDWLSNAISVNLRIDSIIIALMKSTDDAEKKQLHSEIDDGVDQVLTDLASYEDLDLTEEEKLGLANFYDAVQRLTNNQDEVIRLALAGENDKAYKLFREVVKTPREDLIASLQSLRQYKVEQSEQIVNDSIASANASNIRNVIINIISIIILITLGIMISRLITKPLEQLRNQLHKVQHGDFTVQGTYQSKDEIGVLTNSFNETFASLREVLQKVKSSSDHVDNTSQELMANVEQSTSAAEHVVASIQEIASGSEQTKYRLEENAIVIDHVATGFADIRKNIQEVQRLASISFTVAQEGSTIVEQNLTQMQNIKQSIQQSNNVVQTLSNQVGEVDEILKAIEGISQQTNLLALNAAIEAARAGEHGKGFAVVADEVRKLAEQSMNATKSVGTILANIKQDTAESVQIMDVVYTEAENGLAITENTSNKFQDILMHTTEVAPVMTKATHAVEEIVGDFNTFTSSADSILSIAISNSTNSEMVSAASEQQAAAMEDMNHSSRGLAHVATELNEVVKKFTL
ncbi:MULTISPECIES: methyl-accepting chemotaxis protein [unclassified Lysinibacillus]|uniref:methyl-accepting chemotaxis protein n=1 Tax=unclassified Lysinibacillus TaxID=2636778 RepID=UPI00131F0AB2|nr:MULTISPECIES: methyl-accepting chemotaxis protein [unclassified Lysinibacillus]